MIKQLPNILTGSRIVVIPLFVGAFYLGGTWSYWLTSSLFAYASLTDFFDGHLARALKAQTKLGRVLEPIADKLLVAAAILMLVHFDRIDGIDTLAALAILCREILVSGLREFLAEVNVSVPVSSLAKFKTAAQMFALWFLLLAPALPSWLHLFEFGQILLWIAAILTLLTGYAYLRTGLKHM
ncbi:MAG: CDP-diacylglycerol--glycerol-3-phosphate 3-phosphatidyltransferase [Alphaproteobacteria bacterium]|nr:CDP-diacylglycerol--glycerol-3-phosphate 3-phosphatidyltransferase [Alphaproteobacteria bacterium]